MYLQHDYHIIFSVDINNIRSQEAVHKLVGREINDVDYKHLIRDDDAYLTFRIGRES